MVKFILRKFKIFKINHFWKIKLFGHEVKLVKFNLWANRIARASLSFAFATVYRCEFYNAVVRVFFFRCKKKTTQICASLFFLLIETYHKFKIINLRKKNASDLCTIYTVYTLKPCTASAKYRVFMMNLALQISG